MTLEQLKQSVENEGGSVLVYDSVEEFLSEVGGTFGFSSISEGEEKYSGLGISKLKDYQGRVIEVETESGGYTWYRYSDLEEGA